MPWSEVSVMDLRLEFVMLARQPGANVAALCRRFGISRKTGYKWLRRVGSRNPCRPSSTPPSIRSAASSMADGSASRARRSNCPRHSPDTRSVSCPPPATASGTSSSRAAISPNSTGDRAQQKLLPMSPNTCNPCLRSVHQNRGGVRGGEIGDSYPNWAYGLPCALPWKSPWCVCLNRGGGRSWLLKQALIRRLRCQTRSTV